MALVAKKHPFQQGARRDDSGLSSPGIHSEQFHLTRDELRGLFRVGGRACAAAVNVGRDVVYFFAVFVGDCGVVGGSGVCPEDDSVFVD